MTEWITERWKLQINGRTRPDAFEQFARAGQADEMLCVLFRPAPSLDCDAKLHARLQPLTGSAFARKFMEMPASAPNPEKVRRWLETSAAHISQAVSPLKERGPPQA